MPFNTQFTSGPNAAAVMARDRKISEAINAPKFADRNVKTTRIKVNKRTGRFFIYSTKGVNAPLSVMPKLHPSTPSASIPFWQYRIGGHGWQCARGNIFSSEHPRASESKQKRRARELRAATRYLIGDRGARTRHDAPGT